MKAILRPTDEIPPPLACPCRGEAMALVRVNPRLGALPELRTYRCGQCGAVETIEVKQPARAAKQ
jgi:hypothetical protein